jgi:DNA helicase-2/ATP-dependent DNA helicase PcrA
MAKQVMLAVAGAGKTYYICRSINPDQKHLILAYTKENIRNIKRELIDAYGSIPQLTSVMTFHSFVYRYILSPYEPTILRHFGRCNFKRKGITTSDPPPMRITKGGRTFSNPAYKKKDQFEHYIDSHGCYYCSNMSELIMHIKKNRQSLIKKAAASINLFYDRISIDEFQDFREFDYELIIALAKHVDSILLVGDYYQHSVSAVNNSGKPFSLKSNSISYQEYKDLLTGLGFLVDDSTLSLSRRCSKDVCSFVSEKLNINIASHEKNCGGIIWVSENLESVIENDSITKLVFQEAGAYSFNAINWSYSKGDTLDNVCVILTNNFKNMDESSFSIRDIAISTINKLYVAITRTKGDLYLIKGHDFARIKEKYRK